MAAKSNADIHLKKVTVNMKQAAW